MGTITGCSNIFYKTITIYSTLPTFSISPNPTCIGIPVTVSTTTNITFQTIAFNDPNNINDNNPHTYTVAGTYNIFLEGTDNVLGCYNYSVFPITVSANSLPLTITPSSPSICIGGSTTLTASGANSYTWTNSLGTVISTSSLVVVSPTVATTYTVKGTNACGTTSTKTVQVTIIPNYTLTITANPNPLCSGQSATLTASGGTTTANSYTWQASTTTVVTVGNPYVITPTVNATYTIT